jgi:hypothetical protein
MAGSNGVFSKWSASYAACASATGIPRITSFARTSAAFTAFTTASGRISLDALAVLNMHTRVKHGRTEQCARFPSLPVGVAHYPDILEISVGDIGSRRGPYPAKDGHLVGGRIVYCGVAGSQGWASGQRGVELRPNG